MKLTFWDYAHSRKHVLGLIKNTESVLERQYLKIAADALLGCCNSIDKRDEKDLFPVVKKTKKGGKKDAVSEA